MCWTFPLSYWALTYPDAIWEPQRSFPLSDDVWMSLVGALTRGPGVNTALPPPTTPLIRNLPTVTVLSEECPRIMMLYDVKRKWFQRRDSTILHQCGDHKYWSFHILTAWNIHIYMNERQWWHIPPFLLKVWKSVSVTNILYVPCDMCFVVVVMLAVRNRLMAIIYLCIRGFPQWLYGNQTCQYLLNKSWSIWLNLCIACTGEKATVFISPVWHWLFALRKWLNDVYLWHSAIVHTS